MHKSGLHGEGGDSTADSSVELCTLQNFKAKVSQPARFGTMQLGSVFKLYEP